MEEAAEQLKAPGEKQMTFLSAFLLFMVGFFYERAYSKVMLIKTLGKNGKKPF